MHDVLLIGGGVVGLSLAWDLARHGQRVRVIDQSQPGREASWAGAGILPPAGTRHLSHPYEQLATLACELHPRWSADLLAATGIDNGYRLCGGLYLARTTGEAAALAAWAATQADDGLEVRRLSAAELAQLEPALAADHEAARQTAARYLLPGEAQLRNPRHLKALLAACGQAGVEITPDVTSLAFRVESGRLAELHSSIGPLAAQQYCLTAGAWTGELLKQLGIAVGILPIRGQMLLFRTERPLLTRIVNVGSRYLVPRDDGHLLVGSTEEEVGFDKRNTAEGLADLTDFARRLVPALADAPLVRSWAGLRPGSLDGFPFLGRIPGLANAFVAAGHFRHGLYLSPATAMVMSQLMRGETPAIDLAPLAIGR
ncbi:MAG: glycine oxidase ThiO [Pirellulaceae bacterium]|nr:glycine oxidase ThiO [Pirellulaceae bacterium]